MSVPQFGQPNGQQQTGQVADAIGAVPAGHLLLLLRRQRATSNMQLRSADVALVAISHQFFSAVTAAIRLLFARCLLFNVLYFRLVNC